MAEKKKPGIVSSGPNKGRFKPVKGSRFKGCVQTQMRSKGLAKENAQKLCAFIARKKG